MKSDKIYLLEEYLKVDILSGKKVIDLSVGEQLIPLINNGRNNLNSIKLCNTKLQKMGSGKNY